MYVSRLSSQRSSGFWWTSPTTSSIYVPPNASGFSATRAEIENLAPDQNLHYYVTLIRPPRRHDAV